MDLKYFHPAVADWFTQQFSSATQCQLDAWPAIKSGQHVLIAAPTGSGKTLAAFMAAIDDLVREDIDGTLPNETRVLYISPLKALSNDIQKNLQQPLQGIREQLANRGLPDITLRAMVRTGDTPQAERAAMRRLAPHILVSTPESLYILLTSESGREMLQSVNTVIIDEIHALANSKRGAHLALSLARLDHLCAQPVVRVGLSATQKPIERVAEFLVGGAPANTTPCKIIDSGYVRDRDLAIELPASPLETIMSNDLWAEVYEKLVEHIEAHSTTLVFVNTRRMAERVAHHLSDTLGEEHVTSHHGSLSRERRLNAEQRLKAGELKALVATASLELGIDIGDVDLVVQLGTTRWISTFLQRAGRANHAVGGLPKARLFPLNRDELVESVALLDAIRRDELDSLIIPEQPLDVLAQQLVAMVAGDEWETDTLFATITQAWPYRQLTRETFDEVLQMLAEGFSARRGRIGAWLYHDSVNGRVRARKGARITATTSGGAIPDTADYEVRLEPEGTFIGTLDEDFAIESLAGDIFQLGNTSWRILKVDAGVVRVADAQGQPPSIPFWFGEAPARSEEFSTSVARLRELIDQKIDENGNSDAAKTYLRDELKLSDYATQQVIHYLHAARNALGAMPTKQTLIAERFFDESGGMQLVLHSPFGSRVNRAWGLALRKRFCRQFNFELQAAATEDAIILSLGETHSFALDQVWRFLHSNSVKDVLIQALLDAPMFGTRWRWNATTALATPRFLGGKKVPAKIQRMKAEDLVSVVFPDQLACLENIAGEREVPEHPLVQQTIHDCLTEAMDIDGLISILKGIENNETTVMGCDLTEPSPLAQAILVANPYAFLDPAPAEERRTRAVISRRWIDPTEAADIGKLDADAIARVQQEAWPDAQNTDELHDALLLCGFLSEQEMTHSAGWRDLIDQLAADQRARFLSDHKLWIATERQALFDSLIDDKAANHLDALCTVLRGRLAALGPITAAQLHAPIATLVPYKLLEQALISLENEGFVLQGQFTEASLNTDSATDKATSKSVEWCERRLLARIHHYTVTRLRKEIEPVSLADYMRFLLNWQHLTPDAQLQGQASVTEILDQLEGYAATASSWEGALLKDRIQDFQQAWLDQACQSGQFVWARGKAPTNSTSRTRQTNLNLKAMPVHFLRRTAQRFWAIPHSRSETDLSSSALRVYEDLKQNGASFFDDLLTNLRTMPSMLEEHLAELVSQRLISSDSFAGLRRFLRTAKQSERLQRARRRFPSASPLQDQSGRWWLLPSPEAETWEDDQIEYIALALLKRYGVVFRKLLDQESHLPSWRHLLLCYRRLEAQGQIRGGRFVHTVTGEQFALPEAVSSLRAIRKKKSNNQMISVSACDPVNLTGGLLPCPRVPATPGQRLLFRDGVPIASKSGKEITLLQNGETEQNLDWQIRHALATHQNSAS